MSESRVVITADAGRAVQEFQRFRTSAVNALDHVSQAGGVIGKVLGAVGASLSVAAFTGWIKGAIDATDAASDLSQKTGIAIEDLAGMELAFEKGGMEAGALESTMAKLSKQIVDGNEAFERLGVGTKNSTGQLKTNKDMLYELADRFSEMQDGVQKTALAQEIFGKSGAAMIPMLNEGSKGLREMDEMARKLGLSLSEEAVENAGNFNDTLDLLAKGGQGVARGIAAELLPTLSNLTGQFLTTMTSGDKLKNTAAFLAAGLKILYTAGLGIVEVFSTVGKTVGAAGAQLVAILQGNFKQAAEIGRMWQQDVGNSWAATIKSIEAAWDDSSNAAVDSMVSFTRHATVVGKSAAEVAEESKKAAKAHQEEAKALAEVAGLTGDFAGEWDKLSSLYAKGKISLEQLTKAQADLLAKQPAIKGAAEEEEKQRKVLTESAEQYAKAYDLAADAKAKALAGLQAQRDENEAIGLGALELAELNAQREESKAQRAEENAEIAEGLDLTGKMAQEYRDEAAALRALAGEMRQGARKKIAVDEAKSAEDAWKKGAESIEKSLTDALLRGFESGKSIGKNLLDTLKNMFNTLVLRPVISAIVNPVAGAITGALGLSSPASAATGGAGSAMGSVLGSSLGIGGTLGAIGAGALQTAGAVLTGQIGLGTTLSAGLSAIGTGTASGIMAGLSSVVGALGPIALGIGAAVAIWKKLDTSGTYHTGGASSASAAGGVNTIRAESLNFERTRTNAEVEKLTAQLASGVVGILDSTAQAFGKTAGYTAATAFADDTSKDGAWGALRIMLGESKVVDWQDTRSSKWAPKEFANGEAGREQYLAEISKSVRTALDGIGLPGWAKQMLETLGAGAGLDEMAKVVEQINTTQVALKGIESTLSGFSALSDAAVSALIKATGGVQNLAAGAAALYEGFYSEAEKNAAATKQLTAALAAVGLQMPSTRAAYRELFEQTLALGEAGAPAAAVLLANSQAFAQLHPVVEATTSAIGGMERALTASDYATAYTNAGKAVQTELRNVGDIVLQFAERAANAASGVKSARDEISQAYFGVQDEVAAAQKRVTDIAIESARAMATFGGTIKDFLASLNGSMPGVAGIQALKAQFSSTAVLAQAGDKKAQGALAGIAGKLLEAERGASRNGVDFAIREAQLKAALAAIASASGAAAPVEDPAAVAQAELVAAQKKLLEYAALASITGSSTDRAAQVTAGSTAALLASFNAAASADNTARSEYATALRLTSNLALTSTNTLTGLMAGLQNLSKAQDEFLKARDELAAFIVDTETNSKNLDLFTQHLVASLGLTGDEATKLAELLISPGTAASTLAELLGTGALKVAGVTDLLALEISGVQGALPAVLEALQGTGAEAEKLADLLGPTVLGAAADKAASGLGLAGSAARQFASLVSSIKITPPRVEDPKPPAVPPLTQAEIDASKAYNDVLGRVPDADGLKFWAGQLEAGAVTVGGLGVELAKSAVNSAGMSNGSPNWSPTQSAADAAAASKWLREWDVPGFASGGFFGGGLRIVGENGPELEATGPSRIWNAAQTRAILGGAGSTSDNRELVAEIRALRAEVERLRSSAQSTERHAEKTKNVLVRVTRDGEAMQTEEA